MNPDRSLFVVFLTSTLVLACTAIRIGIRKVPLVFFQTPLSLDFTKHTIATLEDQNGSRVILDFVPADRSITLDGAISAVLLLANQYQPGKVRCVKMETTNVPSEELDAIVEDITKNWDENINIYSHNCQDFTRYVQHRVEESHRAADEMIRLPSRSNNNDDDYNDYDEDIPVSNETRQRISYIYDVVVSLLFVGAAVQLANGI